MVYDYVLVVDFIDLFERIRMYNKYEYAPVVKLRAFLLLRENGKKFNIENWF